MKIGYWTFKILGFPLFALLYGFDYKHWEVFYDSHLDYVLCMTVGTGVGVAEAIHQGIESSYTDSTMHSIAMGIIFVCVKSFLGVIVTAITTWLIKTFGGKLKKHLNGLKSKFKK